MDSVTITSAGVVNANEVRIELSNGTDLTLTLAQIFALQVAASGSGSTFERTGEP